MCCVSSRRAGFLPADVLCRSRSSSRRAGSYRPMYRFVAVGNRPCELLIQDTSALRLTKYQTQILPRPFAYTSGYQSEFAKSVALPVGRCKTG